MNGSAAAALPRYIEFGVRSNFSFLRAASKPEQLIVAARLLNHAGMGLADRNTVAGVVRAFNQVKQVDEDMKQTGAELRFAYHPGARLCFSDGFPDILAYPQDRAGWGRLCRMLTAANMRGEKGAPVLLMDDLIEFGAGMNLAVLPDLDAVSERLLVDMGTTVEAFGENVWIAAAPMLGGGDRFRLEQADALSRRFGRPLLAVNDVLYHTPERRPLQDVLTAIRLGKRVDQCGFELTANAERHLKPPIEMARLFSGHGQAIVETMRFSERLGFSLNELKHNYPDEPTEDGRTAQEELEHRTWAGAAWRFPEGVDAAKRETLAKEFGLIAELGYAGYFLTVHNIVLFAKSRGILCQGRGSAANSLICFCLGITDVGPERMNTLFERFISKERGEPPDIDVDFEHEKRSEVMTHIYETYSEKNTSLAAAVISYRSRSAMREVAKALGLSDDTIAALSSATWRWTSDALGETEARGAGLDINDPLTTLLFENANEIMGFPRHLSQHVGGFVITRDRLDEIVPIMKTAMPDRKMIEWDKDDLDTIGLFKVDILALGMLTCLQRCLGLMRDHYPEAGITDLASIPEGENDVYDMICRADTLGVFQIESRAQMTMLPRLRPREFYDLVIEVAIVRPGPIQGDMVHPYLRRREGHEEVEYPHPQLREILHRTLGVPLFQEQAMRIAIEAAGFSPPKADKMRRAMATFRRIGTIGKLKAEFVQGMVKNGYPTDFADRCFKQIEGFGEYGFPESHAASFALLVYVSCWFKTYYPDVFCAAILNAQPMGFYAPAQLVRDAREHGVDIREADINLSEWDCLLEPCGFEQNGIHARHASMRTVIRTRHAVRLGFRQLKGLSESEMRILVAKRGRGYESVRDLWLRSGLPRKTMVLLAQADAFRSIGLDRRAALWNAKALDDGTADESLPLFEETRRMRDLEPPVALPVMPLGEHVVHDYRTMSLSLKAHPVSFMRQQLSERGIVPAERLQTCRNGQRIDVAGLVLVRQRPGSAKGVIFMTIEDETGIANTIVWNRVFDAFRPIILGARFVHIRGKVQKQSRRPSKDAGVIHVVAESIEDLSSWLSVLSEKAVELHSFARADEIQRPVSHAGRDSRGATSDRIEKLIRGMPEYRTDLEALARANHGIMPKGRNFQ